jgi:hypothetical protein
MVLIAATNVMTSINFKLYESNYIVSLKGKIISTLLNCHPVASCLDYFLKNQMNKNLW